MVGIARHRLPKEGWAGVVQVLFVLSSVAVRLFVCYCLIVFILVYNKKIYIVAV